MRKNTYWLIFVLRKGHAFAMNEANGRKWENAPQLNYDAQGWGGGGPSSEINSAFRGVNVTHHQRPREAKKKWFCCQDLVWYGGVGEPSWLQAAVCTSLNSTDREKRQTNTHREYTEQTQACTQRYTKRHTGAELLFTSPACTENHTY